MELSLRARKDSVEKEVSNMSNGLKKAREDTNQEVLKAKSKYQFLREEKSEKH